MPDDVEIGGARSGGEEPAAHVEGFMGSFAAHVPRANKRPANFN